MNKFAWVACWLLVAGTAAAKAPAAPSGLKVAALGVNAFQLDWKDRSSNEAGWEILVGVEPAAKLIRYTLLDTPGLRSHIVVTPELPGKKVSFAVRAYTKAGGKGSFSKPSATMTVTAPAKATFAAPGKFTATGEGDGRVRLRWKDLCSSETGYEVGMRPQGGEWRALGVLSVAKSYDLSIESLDPGQTYSFRLRGTKRKVVGTTTKDVFTPYSKVATATLVGFLAPTQLTAVSKGEPGVGISWRDRSAAESGYEVSVRAGGDFIVLGTVGANATEVPVIGGLPMDTDLQFRVRGFRDVGGVRTFSAYSNTAGVRSAPLKAPTGFSGTPEGETSVRLSWADNSARETNYQLFYSEEGDATETQLLLPGNSTSHLVTGLGAGRTHFFALRAVGARQQGQDLVLESASASTPVLSVAPIPGFRAPTDLAALSEGEAGVSLAWKNRSSLEQGTEIEWRRANGDFALLGSVATGISSVTPIGGLPLDEDLSFRVRAFRALLGQKEYSPYSNVATVKTAKLKPPINPAVSSIAERSAVFGWKDESTRELGYRVQYRVTGQLAFNDLYVPANSSSATVRGLEPGTSYDFRVSAYDATVESLSTAAVTATTLDGFIGDLDPPILWNVPFEKVLEVSDPDTLASIQVAGLPAGLSYDSATRTILGTPTEDGLAAVALEASFAGGHVSQSTLRLRIVRAPAAPVTAAAFDDCAVTVGGEARRALAGKFADPDTSAARRFTTSLGTFDIVLFDRAAPASVANFLAYIDAGRYAQTFFHRSVSSFVVQGGGYAETGGGFSKVATFPPLVNEPGISNLEGTVAFAKLPGDPDSATSEFFINLSDFNAPNLDNQNGGFSVFGRIAGTGMDLFRQVDGLPRGDYTVPIGGSSVALEDVPVNVTGTAPVTIDPATLVRVTAVSVPAFLTYGVASSNPAVADAVVSGGEVVVTGKAVGSAVVTVTATDLDGTSVSQDIAVTVSEPP